MITENTTPEIKSSGIQRSVSFGIKDSGMGHILSILRNQLYSDKVGAVVREYSANAYDANVENGKAETPIRVTLPSPLERNFRVRDFGQGLSPDEITEVYCFYGESTKRNSNAYIGQLGLGSKSGFAYGDNFLINSYVDGIHYTYNAYIDETNLGQIALLSQNPTNEESGVEIVVPVKQEDISAFKRSVERYLRFFKVKPVILGLTSGELEELFRDPITSGTGWAYYPNVGRPTAVMGNIGYPLDSHSLKLSSDDKTTETIRTILNSNIVIDFAIGDLSVAASREGLQYTDITINNIKKAILEVADILRTEITTKLNAVAKSQYGAKLFMQGMNEVIPNFHHIRNVLVKDIMFQGGKLNDNQSIRIDKTSKDGSVKFRVMEYRMRYQSVRGSACDYGTISVSARSEVVFNDMGSYNGGASRARAKAVQNNGSTNKIQTSFLFSPMVGITDPVNPQVIVWKPIKQDQLAKYAPKIEEALEANGFVKEDFSLASSVVLPVAPVAPNTPKSAKKTSVMAWQFDSNSVSGWRSRSGWKGVSVDLKNGVGIYVKVKNCQMVMPDDKKIISQDLLNALRPFPNIKPDSLIGFTESQLPKLGAGWVSLFDVLKDEYEQAMKTSPIDFVTIESNKEAYSKISRFNLVSRTDEKGQKKLLDGITNKTNHEALELAFKSQKFANQQFADKASQDAIAMLNAFNVFGVKYSPVVPNKKSSQVIVDNIVKKVEALFNNYPILNFAECYAYKDNYKEYIKAVIDLLN